jgi:hypothetical protein
LAETDGEYTMKRIALAFATLLGVYLTARAAAEPFLIHWGSPASYRNDWGGPSLAGVLAVHCLPGLILPGYLAWRIWRSPASGARAPAADVDRRARAGHQ